MRAVLILFPIAWLASTISGVAGFGGALLLLPILTAFLGARSAVFVLTIAQILGNLSRAWFGRREIRWDAACRFLIGAVPGSLLGALTASRISGDSLTKLVAVALIGFVIFRRSCPGRPTMPLGRLAIAGAVTGWVSGAAGSAGPLGAAVFLGLDLPPAAFVSTEAVTALSMHAVKTLVYSESNPAVAGAWPVGLILGGAMILGSWTGKRLLGRIDGRLFGGLVDALLLVSALALLSK